MRARIDFDRLNNAAVSQVAQTAVQVLDRIQDGHPEVQLLGMGAAFIAFCRKMRMDPQEVFRATGNMMATKHKDHADFRTLGLYVEHEL